MKARLVIILLLILAAGALSAWFLFFRELPAEHFASDQEHFLYGSIGAEDPAGVPYWIWLVLPRVFPDLLPGPGGYASIGIIGQEGRELPVGFSKRVVGFERVGINCALCHAGTYRLKASDNPIIVPTAPSHQVSPQQYLRFLFACANDSRFNAKTILAEIDKNYRLSWLDRQLYRFALVPLARRSLLKQKRVRNIYGWMKDNPPWGAGRIDPFNPIKYRQLKQPVDDTIGNSKLVPLWNQKQHAGFALHWDGLNGSLPEVVLTSAIGDGATKKWVEVDFKKSDNESSLKRIQKFITETPAPKYPLPINAALAARGQATFEKECASCHAFDGAQTGKVEPIGNPNLLTDRHRIDMWTANAAKAYNDYASGYAWKFAAFVKQEGYVNVPLDGIWLRAPYLHNGSVPTLADLLEEPANRPKVFYSGYDLIDPQKVGFVTEGQAATRTGFRFDTSVPGNGNAGHLWGTKLSAEDKHALIEYMKTL